MNEDKRLHFGVLFTTIDNACSLAIWNGIAEYAEMNDIHLTAYFGTYQSTDEDVALHLETCFETIKNSSFLDGIILFAGFLTKHVDIDSFNEYLAGIPERIPVVSVSFPMPGIPSVLIDSISGIYTAVEHLIKVHGKKKIAFVKGPDGHPEAEDRLAGYKNALTENGIAVDDRLILPGHFSRESGREAIAELLDRRRLSVDAIAACDDESAIGVLSELKDRGINVPADIAVTGFNDDRAAAIFMPSISTARQDFNDIGKTSADILRKMIDREPVDDINYVAPLFIPRQSCGCFEKVFSGAETKTEGLLAEGDTLSTFAQRNIVPLFSGMVPELLVRKWIETLIGELKKIPFSNDSFMHLIDGILIGFDHYSHDFSLWYEVLDILTVSVEYHSDEVGSIHSVLSAIFNATSLVYDIRLKKEQTDKFHLSDARVHLKRVTSELIARFDIDELADELHKSLPLLSLKTILVGLYRTPLKSAVPGSDRTIDTLIGFDGDRRFNMKHNSWNPILFSDYSTIDRFDFGSERRTLFYIPLFFEDEEIGVMLLPFDPDIPVETYESLRISISTAIKGAELLAKIQTLSITDELTGLLNRRGFFQFAYSRMPHLNRDPERMPFIMFMDMDGLKNINDSYGHKEGDVAISVFAEILKVTLREEDIIGRIGGDEFVVFSSVKSQEDGERLVKRIRNELDEYNNKKQRPYIVQSSIGSIILESATRECFESAILNADNILYEEKMVKKKSGLSRQ